MGRRETVRIRPACAWPEVSPAEDCRMRARHRRQSGFGHSSAEPAEEPYAPVARLRAPPLAAARVLRAVARPVQQREAPQPDTRHIAHAAETVRRQWMDRAAARTSGTVMDPR